jgi:Cft2 family RNA processing exonuclease
MILHLERNDARKIEAVYAQYPHDFFIAKIYSLTQTHLPDTFWRDFIHNHTDLEDAVRWYWKFQGRSKPHTSLEKCRVTFLGGGEKIGGTSILISVNGRHILLDAGMFLNEEQPLTNFYVLAEHGLTLGDLDAVIVSHAHVDHTGSLPYIYKEAPQVPIYMTNATAKLMRILLSDSVKFANNMGYEQQHVDGVFATARRQTCNKKFTIPAGDTNWQVTFYEAGHILGAASVHLQMADVSILFTGDFSIDAQRSCSSFQVPDDLHVDILITESTYGYMPSNGRVSRESQEKALLRALKKVTEEKGSFIIPAFAVGRAQEVLFLLKDAYKEEPFYPFNLVVDGKVIDVCNVYEQHAEEPLNLLDNVLIGNEMYGRNGDMTFEEFLANYVQNRPSCIIASSGMLNNGSSSSRYAERLIESSQNAIAFTGYLSGDSPGYQLMKTS